MVALAVAVLVGLAWWVLKVPYEVSFAGETVDCEVTDGARLVNAEVVESCDGARRDRRTTALLIGAAVATAAAAASTVPSRRLTGEALGPESPGPAPPA